MNVAKKLLPVTLPILLSGCTCLFHWSGGSSGSVVRVDAPQTGPMSISRSLDGKVFGGTRVETAGNDTVLTWLETGRKVTIRGVTGFRGTLRMDSADVTVGGLRVFLDEKMLRVKGPKGRNDIVLSAFAPGCDLVVDAEKEGYPVLPARQGPPGQGDP